MYEITHALPLRLGIHMAKTRFCSLGEIIARLSNHSIEILFSPEIVPYRKRSFRYASVNRRLEMQEINYVIKGQITGSVAGKTVHCGPGDAFWMQPRAPHSLVWDEGLIYYSFRFSLLDAREDHSIDSPFMLFTGLEDLESICHGVVMARKHRGAYASEQVKAYFLLMVIALFESVHQAPEGGGSRHFGKAQQRVIVDYCMERGYRNTTPADLAVLVGLSRDYFSRLFRSTFGMSLKRWLLEERMKCAATQLIDTDAPISRIAEALGYFDIYLFSRQFKQIMGVSPRRYRDDNSIMERR